MNLKIEIDELEKLDIVPKVIHTIKTNEEALITRQFKELCRKNILIIEQTKGKTECIKDQFGILRYKYSTEISLKVKQQDYINLLETRIEAALNLLKQGGLICPFEKELIDILEGNNSEVKE